MKTVDIQNRLHLDRHFYIKNVYTILFNKSWVLHFTLAINHDFGLYCLIIPIENGINNASKNFMCAWVCIEHSMVQWKSKSWTFRIQPYSGQIYQWKMQSLALDEKAKWLPWLREKKEQNKVKWWYTFIILLLYGLIKHELHFENWKTIFHR